MRSTYLFLTCRCVGLKCHCVLDCAVNTTGFIIWLKNINQLFHYTMQCYGHKYGCITKRSNQNFRLSTQIYVYKSVIWKTITLSFGVHNQNPSPSFFTVSIGAALSHQKDDIDLNDDKMWMRKDPGVSLGLFWESPSSHAFGGIPDGNMFGHTHKMAILIFHLVETLT